MSLLHLTNWVGVSTGSPGIRDYCYTYLFGCVCVCVCVCMCMHTHVRSCVCVCVFVECVVCVCAQQGSTVSYFGCAHQFLSLLILCTEVGLYVL